MWPASVAETDGRDMNRDRFAHLVAPVVCGLGLVVGCTTSGGNTSGSAGAGPAGMGGVGGGGAGQLAGASGATGIGGGGTAGGQGGDGGLGGASAGAGGGAAGGPGGERSGRNRAGRRRFRRVGWCGPGRLRRARRYGRGRRLQRQRRLRRRRRLRPDRQADRSRHDLRGSNRDHLSLGHGHRRRGALGLHGHGGQARRSGGDHSRAQQLGVPRLRHLPLRHRDAVRPSRASTGGRSTCRRPGRGSGSRSCSRDR